MSHEGYHEPIAELTDATRDMHRAIVSLMEELEAVDWYNQRVDARPRPGAQEDPGAQSQRGEGTRCHVARMDPTRGRGVLEELKDYLSTHEPIAHE